MRWKKEEEKEKKRRISWKYNMKFTKQDLQAGNMRYLV